jgi:hypothetical protein
MPLVLVEGMCIVIFIPLTSVVAQKAGTVIFRYIFAHTMHTNTCSSTRMW